MKENVFWVVKSTLKAGKERWILFNGTPVKIPHRSTHCSYHENKIWTSSHGFCYLKEEIQKFNDIGYDSEPLKVRLEITQDENPDLYMQRYGSCLFISNHVERYWHAVKEDNKIKKIFRKYKWIEDSRVPHVKMISNKLFPEITEETGVVKINIVRI